MANRAVQRIYEQLGGFRFQCETGACRFLFVDCCIFFDVPPSRCGINKIVIAEEDESYYTMRCYRIHYARITLVSESLGIPGSKLRDVFARETGLVANQSAPRW